MVRSADGRAAFADAHGGADGRRVARRKRGLSVRTCSTGCVLHDVRSERLNVACVSGVRQEARCRRIWEVCGERSVEWIDASDVRILGRIDFRAPADVARQGIFGEVKRRILNRRGLRGASQEALVFDVVRGPRLDRSNVDVGVNEVQRIHRTQRKERVRGVWNSDDGRARIDGIEIRHLDAVDVLSEPAGVDRSKVSRPEIARCGVERIHDSRDTCVIVVGKRARLGTRHRVRLKGIRAADRTIQDVDRVGFLRLRQSGSVGVENRRINRVIAAQAIREADVIVGIAEIRTAPVRVRRRRKAQAR